MSQVVALVLCEPEAESSPGNWVREEIFAKDMRASVHFCPKLPSVTATTTEHPAKPSRGLLADAHAAILAHLTRHKSEATSFVFLVVAIFWDGQTEGAKAAFAELRQLTEDRAGPRKQLIHDIDALPPASAETTVEVLVQALNAKKGDHTMHETRAALVRSLEKKLTASQLIRAHGVAPFPAGAPLSSASGASSTTPVASANESAAPSSAGSPSLRVTSDTDLSPAAVDAAVEEGQGECFFLLCAESSDTLAEKRDALRIHSEAVDVAVSQVLPEPREVKAPGGGTLFVQEFLLRRSRDGHHLEVRLAMCGNVDSGKSTLTSVLTRGGRDDGRGAARAYVFNHRHEATTGRTSSVSENHLGFSGIGEVVNYQLTAMRGAANASATATAPVTATADTSGDDAEGRLTRAVAAVTVPRQFTPQELASRSAKVFTLYDLAGHEKYLKTTVLGMTRNMPDYACIVISANNGIQRMTKEHLALCLALKLPFFITVTRIDATPDTVRRETLANIQKLLKIPTVRKLPYPVTKAGEVILAAKNLSKNAIAPIFEVSNVTGQGIPELLQFLNLLPLRKDWRAARAMPREMVIDSTFFVTGVGTVVGGIVTQGVFHVNDTVQLGPDAFGKYRPVSIKSIHVKGVDSPSVEAGNDAAFCLKKEKRSAIRKGNILADLAHPPQAFWQFEAEITILYHSTTITIDYEPVIHSTTVRQSARMTYVERETLRTGDKSLVRFHFLYRPEFMKDGQRLIFREGRTKGIGVVTRLIPEADSQLLAKSKVRKTLLKKSNTAGGGSASTGAAGGSKEGKQK